MEADSRSPTTTERGPAVAALFWRGANSRRTAGGQRSAAPIVKEKEVYRDDIDATADTRIAIAMCHFSGSP